MKLKVIPEDFCVNEILSVNYDINYKEHKFILLNLKKKGFSTFEAANIISDFFRIPVKDIMYAGLKDEDGVTVQKICMDSKYIYIVKSINDFNNIFDFFDKYIMLEVLGYMNQNINIGRLEGNAFKLILRDINVSEMKNLMKIKKYTLFFPNYYGIQRFGIPDEKKVTHLIGEALIKEKYIDAIKYLDISNVPEWKAFKQGDGDLQKFLNGLDDRKLSFYYNSYFSHIYNKKLEKLVKNIGEIQTVDVENIKYSYLKNRKEIMELYNYEFLDIERCYSGEEELKYKMSKRQTVQITNINFYKFKEDKYFDGRYCVTASFVLPAGSYATVAMNQLFCILHNM